MTESQTSNVPWILGLDLGANSIGWAAFRSGAGGEPAGLLYPPAEMPQRPSLGVRVFDEGVENYGQGDREQSRAVKRRMARLQRRQTRRRARRMAKCFRLLQKAGLLPSFQEGAIANHGSPEKARDALLKQLDANLARDLGPRLPPQEQHRVIELLPYALRAYAVEQALRPHEVGRALYHLAQRRGFQSNRKTDARDEERGKVKQGIQALSEDMANEGPGVTLGQFLYRAGLRGERLRCRWTSRRMYQDEFQAVWAVQSRHAPELLTEDLGRQIRSVLFHQRPLKDQSHLIGVCEHENGAEYVDEHGVVVRVRRRRRAPECLLISQRFRIWQSVNNLRIKHEDGSERELELEEKRRLVRELGVLESLGKSKLKKLLGLSPRAKLNVEEALRGNRTNAQLRRIFGARWDQLDLDEQEAVVFEVWSAEDNSSVARRALARMGGWRRLQPTKGEVEQLDDLVVGGDYVSLSRTAMRKLLPVLEQGVSYATAVQQIYGRRVASECHDLLPPVLSLFEDLRNPTVLRSLTELRRVVNTLVREYGKPDVIRIELARDLKRGKEDRKLIQKGMKENEARRDKARARIIAEAGLPAPTGEDILRMRLWEECGGVCPYSGRSIGMGDLFGGRVDIEHIVPFSRCLDDSYLNVTLCFADVNRNDKRNRTPFEAFGHDPDAWDAMVSRMRKNLDNGMPETKLRRFVVTPDDPEGLLEGFKSAQLNDTRHASVRAREYLTSLYGGDLARGVDPQGRTRVQVGNGSVTALLRGVFGINRLLPTSYGRKRDDHRHHAVDAVAVAFTSPAMLKRLSERAEEAWEQRRRRIGGLPPPWDGFEDDVRVCLEQLVISFRIDNRARGPLHAETIYSPRRSESGSPSARGQYTHVRKPVESLSAKDIEAIVDPRVREAVRGFLAGREPKKVCVAGKPDTYPFLTSKTGGRIPVLRARVRKRNTTQTVGSRGRERGVESGENHHLVVKEFVDPRGRRKVQFDPISLFEAARRRADGKPIVSADPTVRFTLRRNDVVRVPDEDGLLRLCRVLSITDGEFEGCWIHDARTKEERTRTGDRVRIRPAKVSAGKDCSKVTVSPIGVVRPCRA